MKKLYLLLIISLVLIYGCNQPANQENIEKWKQEIIDTEEAFSNMSLKEGIPKAFEYFSTDEVVLMRNNKIISGKSAMMETINNSTLNSDKVTLTWKPDFVDVSTSGDLGYTYGTFIFSTKDSLGNTTENKGVFHTVWKRQSNGEWRFVYD